MANLLFAGNWKMNGTGKSLNEVAELAASEIKPGLKVLICPPATLISRMADALKKTDIEVGGQDCHDKPSGAYTGEISAKMLNDAGATYVILGHSERRQLFGETDAVVARKFQAARRASLTPILCVGESRAARQRGEAEAVVRAQLEDVIALCGSSALHDAVIAYEPVWAIGSGETATPEQAQAMHLFIRTCLVDAGRAVRVLYGGSVNAANAAELFAQADVDGALVGGASLDAAAFSAICCAAAASQVCRAAI